MLKKMSEIHNTIKKILGYSDNISTSDLMKHWKKKTTIVCKPCWELKYCPYGPFVEQSPILPPLRKEADNHIAYLKDCLKTGVIGTTINLDDDSKKTYEYIIKDVKSYPNHLLQILDNRIKYEKHLQETVANGNLSHILAINDGSSGVIHITHYIHYQHHSNLYLIPKMSVNYNPPYPYSFEYEENNIEITDELKIALACEIYKMQMALNTGIVDETRPLDNARRLIFENDVKNYNPLDYPVEIPKQISEMTCNIFSHICPIVFVSESAAETTDSRRRGRYISFKSKMRVVRRDNYTCQHCSKHLRDDEVEFDHKIPISKGGSSEEHNIRLTCFDCNRDKSDNIEI